VDPEETAIARQWLGKHVPVALDAHITVGELMEVVFVWSMPKPFDEDQWGQDSQSKVGSWHVQLVVIYDHGNR
jgi:hypothetical protein